jgi:xanthine dehydrogenase accessory factor
MVEGVEARLATDVDSALELLDLGIIPLLVDPEARVRRDITPLLLVDAIVAKRNLGTSLGDAPGVVALGPGFVAGVDAHAVVETKRGHTLGRVIWSGTALPDTGVPGEVEGFSGERVLRASADGVFEAIRDIGTVLQEGEIIGYVGGDPVKTSVAGVLRGLLRSGLRVTRGFKLGDVDPRATPENCFVVSDKALAVAGGVLEAACQLLGGVRFDLPESRPRI